MSGVLPGGTVGTLRGPLQGRSGPSHLSQRAPSFGSSITSGTGSSIQAGRARTQASALLGLEAVAHDRVAAEQLTGLGSVRSASRPWPSVACENSARRSSSYGLALAQVALEACGLGLDGELQPRRPDRPPWIQEHEDSTSSRRALRPRRRDGGNLIVVPRFWHAPHAEPRRRSAVRGARRFQRSGCPRSTRRSSSTAWWPWPNGFLGACSEPR
jgi:hypothetical protein